jgi:hypothetical protein
MYTYTPLSFFFRTSNRSRGRRGSTNVPVNSGGVGHLFVLVVGL